MNPSPAIVRAFERLGAHYPEAGPDAYADRLKQRQREFSAKRRARWRSQGLNSYGNSRAVRSWVYRNGLSKDHAAYMRDWRNRRATLRCVGLGKVG